MFRKSIPPAALADWCRRMRHQLGAGVSLDKLLTHLTDSGPPPLRPLSGRLREAARAGRSLARALEEDPDVDALPALFAPLFRVGEETGSLVEILGELEQYLVLEDRQRRQFQKQTMLPKVQLFGSIFIVAGLIWILGAIAGSRGGEPLTVFGLAGGTGAVLFLTATLGPLALLWLLWNNVAGTPHLRAQAQTVLLRVPAVGPCLQAILLNRFALALQHTLNSSLPVGRALRLSFAATGSAAFEACAEPAAAAVKQGQSVHEALTACPHLPREFLDMVATAEEAGTVPEMMKHQARYYQELAADRLTTLSRLASGGIWLVVAAFIVFLIFRIARLYLSALGG